MTKPKLEKAIIVGVHRKGIISWEVEDNLDELEMLAYTAGAEVTGRIVQDRAYPAPATFIGTGKVRQLSQIVSMGNVDLVVFDDDLSPAQVRNLEEMLSCKVIDRSSLILDIFARRAKTREASIQVEMAQLLYLRPRLTRRWKHLSRQVGGIGFRGPGETQLETDRRVINRRIAHLRKELQRIEKARSTRRRGRMEIFKVALIGYTNAGKSTLLNKLTNAGAFVEDRLFATLDPTVRSLRLQNGRKVLLIDTVGFIRKLPVDLLASFRSTLEESRQADLFLNIVDISHPHWEGQLERTEEVLRELELDRTPQVLVFNKVDLLDDPVLLDGLRRQFPNALFISALRGIRTHEIPKRISFFAQQEWERGCRIFKPDDVESLKEFESNVNVIGRSFKDGMIYIDYLIKVDPNK